jgi:pimeloyl-ACP methyl ester carboxylesterase
MTICRYWLLASLLLFAAAPTALAGDIRPVDQGGWAARKQMAALPNGETIAYLDLGAKDAPPVVLIHGFTDNSRSWSLILPYLEPHFRLIVVDLRGHGASAAPACCYALADMAYDVKLLLDRLGIARADLVGHSLGSMVAQTFAQTWPERAGKLALISSAASAKRIAGPGSWLWNNIHMLRAPIDPNSQFMCDWYANPHPVDEDFLTHERGEAAHVPLDVWLGVDAEMAKADYGALSVFIKSQVLIIWGQEDPLFDADDQAQLRKVIPQAQFFTLPTGHNVMWEKPAETAGLLLGFLGAGLIKTQDTH